MYTLKGFYTGQGYVGFLADGSRMFFPTADEYADYMADLAEGDAA